MRDMFKSLENVFICNFCWHLCAHQSLINLFKCKSCKNLISEEGKPRASPSECKSSAAPAPPASLKCQDWAPPLGFSWGGKRLQNLDRRLLSILKRGYLLDVLVNNSNFEIALRGFAWALYVRKDSVSSECRDKPWLWRGSAGAGWVSNVYKVYALTALSR